MMGKVFSVAVFLGCITTSSAFLSSSCTFFGIGGRVQGLAGIQRRFDAAIDKKSRDSVFLSDILSHRRCVSMQAAGESVGSKVDKD
jgi:hypothetical protein